MSSEASHGRKIDRESCQKCNVSRGGTHEPASRKLSARELARLRLEAVLGRLGVLELAVLEVELVLGGPTSELAGQPAS